MATLLFKLRYVPEDEAEEVRTLLAEHNIDYYETSAGNWRISMPAIWLPDDSQLAEARRLLEDYQQQRYRAARQAYEERKQSGQQRTLWQNFSEDPLRVLFYLGLVLLVIYLSLQVFLSLT
jgi:multidrug efflux pump subunit AcrA (membrane-fusion protein)